MKTCPDCGERVYNLGCVNCNEAAYIDEQVGLDALYESERPRATTTRAVPTTSTASPAPETTP